MSKHVQISQELFLDLVRYFLLDDRSETRLNAILSGLNDKVDKISKHEIYTSSKTAETLQEREQARKQYLDMVGMRDSFRW